MRREEQFERFVAERTPALRGLAYLICGTWDAADDLLQDALVKTYGRWATIKTNPEAYVRRVLVTSAIDDARRPRRRERPTAEVPDAAAAGDAFADVDAREAARAALLALPPRQRAAVALRYWIGLDPDEVAGLLGCSAGTVRSQSARGLATLRASLGHAPAAQEEPR